MYAIKAHELPIWEITRQQFAETERPTSRNPLCPNGSEVHIRPSVLLRDSLNVVVHSIDDGVHGLHIGGRQNKVLRTGLVSATEVLRRTSCLRRADCVDDLEWNENRIWISRTIRVDDYAERLELSSILVQLVTSS